MKIDLHLHTKYSPCSNMEPELLLKTARFKGLNGVGVTDHGTIKGAFDVMKLSKDKDFKVIIGSEMRSDYGDMLVFNQNEDINSNSYMEIIDQAHSQGAIVGMAHPFDPARSRFSKICDDKEYVKALDFIEGFNARTLWSSRDPMEYAKKWNKPTLGGSDAHFHFEIGNCYNKIDDPRKLLKSNGIVINHRSLFLGHACSVLSKLKLI